MKQDHQSTRHEPAHAGGGFESDPAERRVDPQLPKQEEIDLIRDSVANEPWQTDAATGPSFTEWLTRKRIEVSRAGSLWYTLLAALVAGPFAIMGAFVAGHQGVVQTVYILLVGPIVEELLKQSGMIYLLERKPFRIFSAGQFVFAAAVSALIFATLENLMYIHVYALATDVKDPQSFAQFRWTVCTALHVSCSVVASLGLIRVWRQMSLRGEPADLAYGYPLFATAMVMHSMYNGAAMYFHDLF